LLWAFVSLDPGPATARSSAPSAPTASEPVDAAETAAEPVEGRRDTDIAPMDFCALEPKPDDAAYQIQRVLMLDVAEDPSLETGPEFELVRRGETTEKVPRTIFQQVDPFGHAREVLFTVFPMKRHYLILAKTTPPEALASKEPFELDRAREMLAADRFASYSVGCTDWLVAPSMSRREAQWTQVKRKKTVVDAQGNSQQVEYDAWNLTVNFDIRMEIYRRDGDGFVHHATIEGSNGGLRAVTNQNAQAMAAGSWSDIQGSVSVGLPIDCPLPAEGTPTVGFSACGGVSIKFVVDGPSAMGLGQKTGPYCANLDDSVERGEEGMRDVARCVLRQQVENATQEIQLEAKKVCGWRLYSELVAVPGGKQRGVSMGKHEGARRGDYYIARKSGSSADAQCVEGEEVGFARITKLGPGGEEGEANPSVVKFRTGDAPLGTHMTEYAMHGARLGLEPKIGFVFVKGELESTVVGGGVLRLGYDLSRFIPVFDEVWSVGGIGYLRGANRETYVTYDVGIELDQYVLRRWAIFAGLGMGGTSVFKKVRRTAEGATGDVLLGGGVFATYLRGGPEVTLRPDWHLRFLLEFRSGLHRATLENEEDAPGQTLNGGPLLGVSAGISAAHTF
jgi:hypothetical protein